MADIELVFNNAGDWMGVYKDGYLARQGHSIEPEALLELCDVPHRVRSVAMEDGHLPPLLSAVR